MSTPEPQPLDPALTPVTVTIGHLFATVNPPIISLQPLLSARQFIYEPGGPHGCQRVTECLVQYKLSERGDLKIPTGLVHRVLQHLRGQGHPVRVTDLRQFGLRCKPDSAVIAAAEATDRPFLKAVAERTFGQLEIGGLRELVRRAAQITKLFPNARVLIVTARRCTARAIHRMLKHALQEPVALAVTGTPPAACRIAVATHRQVSAWDPRNIRVLLLADPEELRGKEPLHAFVYMTRRAKRIYAFVRPGCHPGDALALRIEAAAGPVIFSQRPRTAEVRVQICRSVSCPLPGNLAPGLERKRQAIWHNDRRNACIAAVAQAAAAGDLDDLWQRGLFLAPQDEGWLRRSRRTVAILVESPEHGRELLALLPGWKLLTANDADAADANAAPPKIEHQTASGSPPAGTICTMARAAGLGISAEVVVRVDGGSSMPPIRGFPPPATAHPGRVHLIDMDDDADAQARRDTQQRLQGYRDRGWGMDGRDCRDTHAPADGHEHNRISTAQASAATMPAANSGSNGSTSALASTAASNPAAPKRDSKAGTLTVAHSQGDKRTNRNGTGAAGPANTAGHTNGQTKTRNPQHGSSKPPYEPSCSSPTFSNCCNPAPTASADSGRSSGKGSTSSTATLQTVHAEQMTPATSSKARKEAAHS